MKKLKRYYAESGSFAGDIATVCGSEYNHMINVMREIIGSRVLLCTGDGLDNVSEIIEIGKSSVTLKILSTEKNPREPKIQLTCFCGLLKSDHFEMAVQKLSELGVKTVVPFISSHTVAKQAKADRLKKISQESAKQCNRSGVMNIEEEISFQKMLDRLQGYDLVLFCFESEDKKTIKQALKEHKTAIKVAVITGSEGGFSVAEAEKLIQSGANSVTLGRRILRAETAAIYAAGIVMYELDN